MPVRVEVLADIQKRIATEGKIVQSKSDGRRAAANLEAKRIEYTEARRPDLEHQLTRFYNVAFFGSARIKPDSPEFNFITDLSSALILARPDIDITTGGGPGIMAAGIIGAYQAKEIINTSGNSSKSRRHGIGLKGLPTEEKAPEHVDFHTMHDDIASRLQHFTDYSQGVYLAPGGIGTDLERALIVQLLQIGHLEKEYNFLAHPDWIPLFLTLKKQLYDDRIKDGKEPLMHEDDFDFVWFSDDIEFIVKKFSAGYDYWYENIRQYVEVVD